MIALPPGMDVRVREALARAGSAREVRWALGPAFRALDAPEPSVAAWVHARFGAIVEVALDASGGVAAAALLVGEDARIWFGDRLSRCEGVDEVSHQVVQVGGPDPIVLDASARTSRWLLPRLCRVVEVRGRRTVERVRVLDAEQSLRAVDSVARLCDSAEGWPLGPARPLARGTVSLLDGALVASPLDGSGFTVVSGESAAQALVAALGEGAAIDRVDRHVGAGFREYRRAEEADSDGIPRVTWRLEGLGVDLVWGAGRLRHRVW